MNIQTIDTDGHIDHCSECKANARFVKTLDKWYVRCSECGNAIKPQETRIEALIVWNKEQRES